jgi:hypothetical protein
LFSEPLVFVVYGTFMFDARRGQQNIGRTPP